MRSEKGLKVLRRANESLFHKGEDASKSEKIGKKKGKTVTEILHFILKPCLCR